MLITITGKAGSGKGTASKELAEKLGYRYISIGDMKREIAVQMGINIIEFNKLGEQPENVREFDLKYEEYQRGLDPQDAIILESRLGFWCQPDSFKVFLTVDDKSAAQRIFNQKRETDKYDSWEEVFEDTKRRNEEDTMRYEKLYGFNYQDPKNFDLIVDTTNQTVDQTVEAVLTAFETWKQKKSVS